MTKLRFIMNFDTINVHHSSKFNDDSRNFIKNDTFMKKLIKILFDNLVEINQQNKRFIVQFVH